VNRKEWAELETGLKRFLRGEWDLIEELYEPFLDRFNDTMVQIDHLVTNKEVAQAIRLKQDFLNGLSSHYDDIQSMFDQMTDAIGEIQKSLS
jgi:hypothetical protein